MSDHVFVVQEQPTGRWIAACCDARCEPHPSGGGMHTLADTARKADADRAAARHRALLRTVPPEDGQSLPDACQHCGQSTRAITLLQEQVARLEALLAQRSEVPA